MPSRKCSDVLVEYPAFTLLGRKTGYPGASESVWTAAAMQPSIPRTSVAPAAESGLVYGRVDWALKPKTQGHFLATSSGKNIRFDKLLFGGVGWVCKIC